MMASAVPDESDVLAKNETSQTEKMSEPPTLTREGER
jgi:hypothetical protein